MRGVQAAISEQLDRYLNVSTQYDRGSVNLEQRAAFEQHAKQTSEGAGNGSFKVYSRVVIHQCWVVRRASQSGRASTSDIPGSPPASDIPGSPPARNVSSSATNSDVAGQRS
jgi:hypothetical protein